MTSINEPIRLLHYRLINLILHLPKAYNTLQVLHFFNTSFAHFLQVNSTTLHALCATTLYMQRCALYICYKFSCSGTMELYIFYKISCPSTTVLYGWPVLYPWPQYAYIATVLQKGDKWCVQPLGPSGPSLYSRKVIIDLYSLGPSALRSKVLNDVEWYTLRPVGTAVGCGCRLCKNV